MNAPAGSWVLLGVFVGCASPAPGDSSGDAAAGAAAEAPSEDGAVCPEPPAGSLGLLADANACGWAVLRGGDAVVEMGGEGRLAMEAPAGCGTGCVWSGAVTSVGPVLVAAEASATSEVPAQVHLGVPDGDVMRFIELWAGPRVRGDGTDLGPAFALAPHDCGGALALVVERRLPRSGDRQVPPEVRARAGAVAFADGIYVPGESTGAADCTPLDLPLP